MKGGPIERARGNEPPFVLARHSHVDRVGHPFASLNAADDPIVAGRTRVGSDIDPLGGTELAEVVGQRHVVITDAFSAAVESLRFDRPRDVGGRCEIRTVGRGAKRSRSGGSQAKKKDGFRCGSRVLRHRACRGARQCAFLDHGCVASVVVVRCRARTELGVRAETTSEVDSRQFLVAARPSSSTGPLASCATHSAIPLPSNGVTARRRQ